MKRNNIKYEAKIILNSEDTKEIKGRKTINKVLLFLNTVDVQKLLVLENLLYFMLVKTDKKRKLTGEFILQIKNRD